MENSLGGFEFLSCIPGSVGGGIKMNAGCFNREFKDILISIQALNKSGQIITILSKDINFSYRESGLPDDLIFLSASFQGKKKNREEINKEINKLKEEKNRRQPSRIKTGGSTFKNPINQTDIKVWELIKNSIPTTKSFGDAKISEKHCNFLVNSKNAKFEDMMKLINFIKSEVDKKKNIKLETEIEIIE